MATLNPLERKARQSFIKGIALTTVIALIAVAGLIIRIYKLKDVQKKEIASRKKVYIVNRNIKSGEEINAKDIKQVEANQDVAIASISGTDVINMRAPQTDENGNIVKPPKKLIAKIDLPKSTILTPNLVEREDIQVTKDLREIEFNCIVLPSNVTDKDTIDIRLRTGAGEEYLVLPKKQIRIVDKSEKPGMGINHFYTDLTESEIITINAAIVESYKIKGAKLYAVKYVEPGMQEKAIATYIPPANIINMITTDPNVVDVARNAIQKKWQDGLLVFRTPIANAMAASGEPEEQATRAEQGTAKEIEQAIKDRKAYLSLVEEN